MALSDTVATLLKQAPGDPLCSPCLAFACSCSLTEMWAVVDALVQQPEFPSSATSPCTSCRRMTTTITYMSLAKCAHCSRPIRDAGLGIVMGGDQFHRACWSRLLSDQRIRLSRSLSRQSRELIARARAQLDRSRPEAQ
jgi:hypothetical protein